MIPSLLPLGVGALLGAATVLAATDPPACTLDKKCPESSPCCSQYGQCGAGAFCLGGCDPRMSFSLDSCVPAPVCEDRKYDMSAKDRYKDIGEYLGDPTDTDWVGQGEPTWFKGNTLLTMPKGSVGTVMASTTYMWYGNVKAKMKTSKDAGVVTAFILFSDVKDEIDYEWVGTELGAAQTNYYFQGIPDYTHGGNITGISNTYDNFHEYEIDWTPEKITWLVDGKVERTQLKKDTFNKTSNQYDYPQTPSRVQLSLWPGGLETNAEGTVKWAGGYIDWDSDEIKKYSYYFATVSDVTVKCYKASSPPGTNKGVSYWYTDIKATEDKVMDGDKPTVLKSFLGTGTDMDAGESTDSSKPSASTVHTIPGGSVNPGNEVPGGGGTSDTSGSDSSTDGGSSSSSKCDTDGFDQFCNKDGGSGSSGGNNQNNGVRGAERTLGASAFAVVIGFAGLLFL